MYLCVSTLRHSDLSVAFNATCKALKQDLCRIYNGYRSSGDIKLPNSYFYTKQCLNKAIQLCSQQASENIWCRLEKTISSNNSKLFWRLISGHLSPPRVESNIPAASWISHFKNLFSDDNVHEPPLDYLILDESPCWPPVTANEVELLIGQLKYGKAPGPDKIPSDLIKAAPHWWAVIFAHLFTRAESTGIIPVSWRQSLIIPIF